MKKFDLVLAFIILSIVLVGCQVVDAGIDDVTVSPLASSTAALAVDSPVVMETAQETATPEVVSPTATLVVTSTPTPAYFVCPNLYGVTASHTFSSEAMREEVAYLVHLPPCYDVYDTAAFPVLYLFHGWPLNEQHWLSLGVDVLVDDWIGRGIVGPFIIVLPGVNEDGLYVNSSGGDSSFEGMIVNELVPLIDQSYRTWRSPDARAVGGISRGGVWALEIAMRHKDVFSSVGAHSPALGLNRPYVNYDPFVLAKEDMSGLRFYLDAGSTDWAKASTIRFRDLLEDLEIDVTYEVHEGGHVDDLWRSALGDYVSFYTLHWPPSFDSLPTYLNE